MNAPCNIHISHSISEGDFKALDALIDDCKLFGAETAKRHKNAARSSEYSTFSHRVWVIEATGTVVGWVAAGIELAERPGEAYLSGKLYAIYVRPEYRGFGFSRAAIHRVCRDLSTSITGELKSQSFDEEGDEDLVTCDMEISADCVSAEGRGCVDVFTKALRYEVDAALSNYPYFLREIDDSTKNYF